MTTGYSGYLVRCFVDDVMSSKTVVERACLSLYRFLCRNKFVVFFGGLHYITTHTHDDVDVW
jgi:hypothetical protein